MASTISSSGDDSVPKGPFHPSLCSSGKILEKIFRFLSVQDFMNCRLVCTAWRNAFWAQFNEIIADPTYRSHGRATFHGVMLEPIVDQIIKSLPSKQEQCQSRLISQTFNHLIKHKLSFAPVLTDSTLIAVVSTDEDLHVTQLVVRDLFATLPQTREEGKLDCNFNPAQVKSIVFYEGVPAKNKQILLQSFPRLTNLSYVGSSSFVHFPDDSQCFEYLHKLHIKADCSNDTGSLVEFLSKAKFPVLNSLHMNFYFRREFFTYFEAHNFIGNHHSTLKDVTLKFCAKHDHHALESVDGMTVTYTPQLFKQFRELTETKFKVLQLDSLSLDFLPFEGTSLFTLGFELAESQKRLKKLRLSKEYTYTRNELLPLTSILLNNAKTLVDISIPHPYAFNCNWIHESRALESLEIGESPDNKFPVMFPDSELLNIFYLPRPPTFVNLKVGIRLTREQVDWIVCHHQLVEFYFNGSQADQYKLEDIQRIISQQVKLTKFGFNCDMERAQYDLIADYCRNNEGAICFQAIYGEEEYYVSLGNSRGNFQISLDRQVFNKNQSNSIAEDSNNNAEQ